MLGVILKIGSILGIILLILLAVLIFLLILVLFFPIRYRADAEIEYEQIKAKAKIYWLFGLLRADITYPEPGKFIWKVLGIPIADSKSLKSSEPKSDPAVVSTENHQESDKQSEENLSETVGSTEQKEQQNTTFTDKKIKNKLFEKYAKIKYTIQSFYGNIKHILKNISFYKKLLQDEETKLLFSHVYKKAGRVLRHIFPAKIKANVVFGADSPDTTGYVYGIYCMFSPKLGKDVCIIPDFEQKILQGTIHLAGHITVFNLLMNVLAVLLDKHLRLFIHRLKKHAATQTADK